MRNESLRDEMCIRIREVDKQPAEVKTGREQRRERRKKQRKLTKY